jgi:hypothetical protein
MHFAEVFWGSEFRIDPPLGIRLGKAQHDTFLVVLALVVFEVIG